jgi:hypothetical protein
MMRSPMSREKGLELVAMTSMTVTLRTLVPRILRWLLPARCGLGSTTGAYRERSQQWQGAPPCSIRVQEEERQKETGGANVAR